MLVVIAIIGVLAALLLPAVQAAREAARRTHCLNNSRQLGVACQSYIDTVGRFPPGSLNYPDPAQPQPWLRGSRTTFMIHLFPYLENDALYQRYDFNEPSDGWAAHSYASWVNSPNSVPTANWQAPTSVEVPFFYCPSDPGNRTYEWQRSGGVNVYALSNYLGVFGDKDYGLLYGAGRDYDGSPAKRPGQIGFRYHVFGVNFGAKPTHIKDGLSNTMVFAEYLRARGGGPSDGNGNAADSRGNIWADQPGKSMLFTQHTPNASAPDLLYPDQCYNAVELNLPCAVTTEFAVADFASSRSLHTGGVVAITVADGSVRFIHEGIDIRLWRSLGTINNKDMILEEFN
jgi:type II secretory pathway pseudopilin PulG